MEFFIQTVFKYFSVWSSVSFPSVDQNIGFYFSPRDPWASAHFFLFQPIFSLFFRLGNFCCLALSSLILYFLFSGLLLSLLTEFFILVIDFFSLKFSFVSFLYLLFFAETFFFVPTFQLCFVAACWGILKTTALKYLSDNLKSSVTLGLASDDCAFKLFDVFLVLGMMHDFWLKPRYFG